MIALICMTNAETYFAWNECTQFMVTQKQTTALILINPRRALEDDDPDAWLVHAMYEGYFAAAELTQIPFVPIFTKL